jgi:hypothetical protein
VLRVETVELTVERPVETAWLTLVLIIVDWLANSVFRFWMFAASL